MKQVEIAVYAHEVRLLQQGFPQLQHKQQQFVGLRQVDINQFEGEINASGMNLEQCADWQQQQVALLKLVVYQVDAEFGSSLHNQDHLRIEGAERLLQWHVRYPLCHPFFRQTFLFHATGKRWFFVHITVFGRLFGNI